MDSNYFKTSLVFTPGDTKLGELPDRSAVDTGGETARKKRLLGNNFATWCLAGAPKSLQTWTPDVCPLDCVAARESFS